MKFRVNFLCGILASLFLIAPVGMANPDPPSQTEAKNDFETFAGLRSDLLSKIGGATKRVWIVTDFLTDAEIVSSLYIAQYRKVNIHVLLGRDKAPHILSRLNYLKQVNIPVAIRPKGFYSKYQSLILVDDRLMGINTDLDYLVKGRKFKITEIPNEDQSAFEVAFLDASKNQDIPPTKALPLVGNPRHNRGSQKKIGDHAVGSPISTTQPQDLPNTDDGAPGESPENSKPQTLTGTTTADGAYRYRHVKERPQKGVPTKLPKMTLSQELERQRAAEAKKTPSTPTESP